jgi:hypothetical protein
MISYNATYSAGNKPYLAKTIAVGSESYTTKLGANMPEEELLLIPLSDIYAHLDNLVLYMKSIALTLRVPLLDESGVDLSYPVIGYRDIESAYTEARDWFDYVYKNREPEELDEETPA